MSENVKTSSKYHHEIIEPLLRTLTLDIIHAKRAKLINPPLNKSWYSQPFPTVSYAVKGTSRISLKARKSPLKVMEGCCVFIPGGAMRQVKRKLNSGLLIRDFMHFDITALNGISVLPFFDIPCLFAGEDADNLHSILSKIIANKAGIHEQETIKKGIEDFGIMFDLLRILLKNATPRREWRKYLNAHQRLSGTLNFISNNLFEAISIEKLCKISLMSASTLTRTFRASFGITPLAYVRRLRLERAQYLLLTTDMSLTEVAITLGYADVFIFSKAFSREFGTPPSVYRQIELQEE